MHLFFSYMLSLSALLVLWENNPCLFLVFCRENAEYTGACREEEGEGGGKNAACQDRECKKK